MYQEAGNPVMLYKLPVFMLVHLLHTQVAAPAVDPLYKRKRKGHPQQLYCFILPI